MTVLSIVAVSTFTSVRRSFSTTGSTIHAWTWFARVSYKKNVLCASVCILWQNLNLKKSTYESQGIKSINHCFDFFIHIRYWLIDYNTNKSKDRKQYSLHCPLPTLHTRNPVCMTFTLTVLLLKQRNIGFVIQLKLKTQRFRTINKKVVKADENSNVM